MKTPLFVVHDEEQGLWRAAVKHGPIVERPNRRNAIRNAIEQWLKSCGALATNHHVREARRTEIEIRNLEYLNAFDLCLKESGMAPVPRE